MQIILKKFLIICLLFSIVIMFAFVAQSETHYLNIKTYESLIQSKDNLLATTTEKILTEEILSNDILKEEKLEEKLKDSVIEEIDLVEEIKSEENFLEEIIYLEPEIIVSLILPLSERILDRDIEIIYGAEHLCKAEVFSIDISRKPLSHTRVLLRGIVSRAGEIEIGSLPFGIDILFSQNRDYLHGVFEKDSALDLEIMNQEGSQKGNFSIPIIFTDKERNQTTVCQMNIINF